MQTKVYYNTLFSRNRQYLTITNILLWFRSYLVGRSQYVRFNNTISDLFKVISHGSHLGPVLFIIFINDLPSVLKYSNCLQFTDDLKLLIKRFRLSFINISKTNYRILVKFWNLLMNKTIKRMLFEV